MSKTKIPKALLDKAASIVGKRSRIVVDVILEKGFVTTEDLKDRGYNHPPRAIKDVTDQGLPLVRSWSRGRDGRKMASYALGKDAAICKTCYWASPEEYSHIAEAPIRRVDVTWNQEEVAEYDLVKLAAKQAGVTLPEFVKRALRL